MQVHGSTGPFSGPPESLRWIIESYPAAGAGHFRGHAMLTVLGKPRRCCDGVSRRELLQAGALSFFGTLLAPPLSTLRAASPQPSASRVKSVLLLDLFGGPGQLDSCDSKPRAPGGIRGMLQQCTASL